MNYYVPPPMIRPQVKDKKIAIVLVLILLTGLGALVYFLYDKIKKTKSTTPTSNTTNPSQPTNVTTTTNPSQPTNVTTTTNPSQSTTNPKITVTPRPTTFTNPKCGSYEGIPKCLGRINDKPYCFGSSTSCDLREKLCTTDDICISYDINASNKYNVTNCSDVLPGSWEEIACEYNLVDSYVEKIIFSSTTSRYELPPGYFYSYSLNGNYSLYMTSNIQKVDFNDINNYRGYSFTTSGDITLPNSQYNIVVVPKIGFKIKFFSQTNQSSLIREIPSFFGQQTLTFNSSVKSIEIPIGIKLSFYKNQVHQDNLILSVNGGKINLPNEKINGDLILLSEDEVQITQNVGIPLPTIFIPTPVPIPTCTVTNQEVIFYSEANYSGRCMKFGSGDHIAVFNWPFKSIKIPDNFNVTGYNNNNNNILFTYNNPDKNNIDISIPQQIKIKVTKTAVDLIDPGTVITTKPPPVSLTCLGQGPVTLYSEPNYGKDSNGNVIDGTKCLKLNLGINNINLNWIIKSVFLAENDLLVIGQRTDDATWKFNIEFSSSQTNLSARPFNPYYTGSLKFDIQRNSLIEPNRVVQPTSNVYPTFYDGGNYNGNSFVLKPGIYDVTYLRTFNVTTIRSIKPNDYVIDIHILDGRYNTLYDNIHKNSANWKLTNIDFDIIPDGTKYTLTNGKRPITFINVYEPYATNGQINNISVLSLCGANSGFEFYTFYLPKGNYYSIQLGAYLPQNDNYTGFKSKQVFNEIRQLRLNSTTTVQTYTNDGFNGTSNTYSPGTWHCLQTSIKSMKII